MGSEDEAIISVSPKERPGRSSEWVSTAVALALRWETGIEVEVDCTVLPKEMPVSIEDRGRVV